MIDRKQARACTYTQDIFPFEPDDQTVMSRRSTGVSSDTQRQSQTELDRDRQRQTGRDRETRSRLASEQKRTETMKEKET